MATVKGQNLRLLIGGKCVAAATSATLHIAAQVEAISTKDDVDGWQRQICTGKNWDLGVEALVMPEVNEVIAVKCYSASSSMFLSDPIALKKGDKITLTDKSDAAMTILVANSPVGDTYEATEAMSCVVASGTKNSTCKGELSDVGAVSAQDLVNMVKTGATVNVSFSVVEGAQNREPVEVLCSGEALLADASVTAGNKTVSTVSASLTGTGELALA